MNHFGARLVALFAFAGLAVAGCSPAPVSTWDGLQSGITRARERHNHPFEVELSRRLVTLACEVQPTDSTRLVESYDVLQQALMSAGDYHEAYKYQLHVTGLLQLVARPDSARWRRLLLQAADGARRSDHPAAAESLVGRAVELHELNGLRDARAASEALADLAAARAASGRWNEAADLQRRALDVDATRGDTTSLRPAQLAVQLAHYEQRLGRAAEAETLLARALGSGARAWGEDHPGLAPLYLAWGEFLHGRARWAEAAPALGHGLRLAAVDPAGSREQRAPYERMLADCREHIGDAPPADSERGPR